MLRASVAAEAAGIASVSIVCEGFVGQARATAKGMGYAGIPLAVCLGHVDSQSAEVMIANFLATTVDEVIAGLTTGLDASESEAIEYGSREVVLTGTLDEVQRHFTDHGWTDGLPIVPPTIERVEQFLARSHLAADTVIGLARPTNRQLTVWSVAVNAVMAGCRPEHMGVLLALAEVICDPGYGVQHSGNTTGADALIVLNGPAGATLGFNSGQGALRDGYEANTSVGRWFRLMLRNVCGFVPGEHDKATFGNSMRVVLTEDEATLRDIGWAPYAADFGFAAGDDVVTVGRYNSGIIVGSVFGSTPEQILPYLANGLTRVTGWELTHVFGLGQGQYRPMLVLSPVLARVFADAGWSKDDLRQALFEQARIPASLFERFIGEWSNLTAGRRTLVDVVAFRKLPKVFAESRDPDRLVPIVTDPSCFGIVVAGDPNRTNAYVLSNDGPHGFPTAARIHPGHP